MFKVCNYSFQIHILFIVYKIYALLETLRSESIYSKYICKFNIDTEMLIDPSTGTNSLVSWDNTYVYVSVINFYNK